MLVGFRLRRVLVASLWLHLCACGPRQPEDCYVEVEPRDLTSRVGVLELGVEDPWHDGVVARDLTRAVHVVDLQTGKPVPVSISAPVPNGSPVATRPLLVMLLPGAGQALAMTWHELRFDPGTLYLGAGCYRQKVRFHPGSDPVIRSIGVGRKPGGSWSGGVRFSEPLDLGDGRADQCLILTQPSTGYRCDALGPFAIDDTGVEFRCSAAGTDDSPLRLELRPGIVSVTGAPLTVFGGGTSAVIDIPLSDGVWSKVF